MTSDASSVWRPLRSKVVPFSPPADTAFDKEAELVDMTSTKVDASLGRPGALGRGFSDGSTGSTEEGKEASVGV